MSKPTLLIQTAYFALADQSKAEELGLLLYENLTRTRRDKLAFGPGIPVRVATRADLVDPEAAEHVAVIPVLGPGTSQDEQRRDSAIELLNDWQARLREKGVLLPVFTTEAWRNFEERLPVKPVLQFLYDDKKNGFQFTLLELVVSVCRLLRDPAKSLRIFISHAKTDLESTKRAAEHIRRFAKENTTVQAFFDTTDLASGEKLALQLQQAAGAGVFLALRSDYYASRHWCQRELLWAKRSGLPTLCVEVLRDGEARSYPYAGNSPTLVWPEQVTDEADTGVSRIVLRATVEWLRARHFDLEAPRIAAELPRTTALSRAPELLDFAQGPLLADVSSVVLHPDPELSFAERAVLRAARPRIKLLTPTTLYRGIDDRQRAGSPLPSAPLRDRQVALSISDLIDDAATAHGLRKEHVDDMFVYLTRALIGAGSAIAYGGDFRLRGYDDDLTELISTYNAAGVDRAKFVYSYVPAFLTEADVPAQSAATIRSLGWTEKYVAHGGSEPAEPEGSVRALLPVPTAPLSPARAALYVSDMRRVMAKECFARVILGGQASPQRDGAAVGYRGPFPGVVEEAWYTLRAGRPLYVLGGFGGAAALIAESFDDQTQLPRRLRAASFAAPEYSAYRRLAQEFTDDPDLSRVGAPATMEALAVNLRDGLNAVLASDQTALAWNGLTRAENRELLRSRDVVRATSLVMKGLLGVRAAENKGKLNIELLRGNVVRAERASAIAVSTLRDVDITGPGAALDAATGNAVTGAKRDGHALIELTSPQVDAEWLLIADLGDLGTLDRAALPDLIEQRAAEIAALALRHDFERIALVTFAATILENIEDIAERMVAGFRPLATATVLQWFEYDEARFERLKRALGENEDVSLTLRELPEFVADPPAEKRGDAIAVVRVLDENTLQSTLLLPSGPAVSREHRHAFSDFKALDHSAETTTPSLETIARIGTNLSELLFGKAGSELLREHAGATLVIQHDVESASIPFETLRVEDPKLGSKAGVLGLAGGIVRRPSLRQDLLPPLPKRPPRTGKLKLLLVVDPTENLQSARDEAAAIRTKLADGEVVVNQDLTGKAATTRALLAALEDPSYDVLHFAGHAFFNQLGESGSGLKCADGDLLLKDLKGRAIGPRIVFFNACQSARVRGESIPLVTQALAEYVLASGVEAYLGTLWSVLDNAAAHFAVQVYRELAKGKKLHEAVVTARNLLFDNGNRDWANYVLYGSGSFQLKTG